MRRHGKTQGHGNREIEALGESRAASLDLVELEHRLEMQLHMVPDSEYSCIRECTCVGGHCDVECGGKCPMVCDSFCGRKIVCVPDS